MEKFWVHSISIQYSQIKLLTRMDVQFISTKGYLVLKIKLYMTF